MNSILEDNIKGFLDSVKECRKTMRTDQIFTPPINSREWLSFTLKNGAFKMWIWLVDYFHPCMEVFTKMDYLKCAVIGGAGEKVLKRFIDSGRIFANLDNAPKVVEELMLLALDHDNINTFEAFKCFGYPSPSKEKINAVLLK